MKQIAKGHGFGARRFAKLNLLKLSCPEPNAAKRVISAMSLIVHEWEVSAFNTGRRIDIEIKSNVIRTNR